MNTLIFIESNTSGTGRLFIRAAWELGYTPIMLTADPASYAYLAQDEITTVCVDTGDFEEMRRRIEELRTQTPVAGCWSSSEYWIEAAAKLAGVFGTPGMNPEAIAVCRNKARQKECLRQAGVYTPHFIVASSLTESCAALSTIPLPVVIKPTEGTGSVGVQLCRTREDLREMAAALFRRTVNERGRPIPHRILIEEFIDGPEFSVETFGDHVIGVTRKYLSLEPHFVEIGHDFPCHLTPDEKQAIVTAARRGLAAVGLRDGPAHIELRWGPNGPAIIEINPRLAGGFIPELVRLASGVDLIRAAILFSAGQPFELEGPGRRHASIRFLVPSESGLMESIEGADAVRRMKGVVEVKLYRTPGSRVSINGDFRDRIGHVITCGDQEREAASLADRAREAIRVRVLPEP